MTHQERTNLISKVCNGNTMLFGSETTSSYSLEEDRMECINCRDIIPVCDEHKSGLCVSCYMDNKEVMKKYNLK